MDDGELKEEVMKFLARHPVVTLIIASLIMGVLLHIAGVKFSSPIEYRHGKWTVNYDHRNPTDYP